MAKKGKKSSVDFSALKATMFAKSEKIGLGVAVAIMALMLLLGLLSLGATSQDKELKTAAENLRNRMRNAHPTEDSITIGNITKGLEYAAASPSPYVNRATWFDPGAVGENRVGNPIVLPVAGLGKDKSKNFQIDVVRAPVYVHERDFDGRSVKVLLTADGKFITGGGGGEGYPGAGPGGSPGGGKGFGGSPGGGPGGGFPGGGYPGGGEGGMGATNSPRLARFIDAERMVVVSASFPYKEQLEVFRKALRKTSVQEIFNGPDAPKFFGLNVKRCEKKYDGTYTEWVDVYFPDEKDLTKNVTRPDIKELLQNAQLDDTNIRKLGDYLHVGLATPLPKLAKGDYPELKIKGIDPKKITVVTGNEGYPGGFPGDGGGSPGGFPGQGGGKGGFPGSGGPGGQPGEGGNQTAGSTNQIGRLPLAKLAKTNPDIADKLIGKIELFHPMALVTNSKDKKNNTGGNNGYPGSPGGGKGGLGMPGGPGEGGEGGMFGGSGNPNFPYRGMGGNTGGGMGPGGGTPGFPGNPGDGQGEGNSGYPGSGGGMMTGDVPETVLVRFIDINVDPGKTYVYSVQIRMANPNYKKTDRVMFRALSDMQELLSAWVVTPEVAIPNEYQYFVVDQHDVDPDAKQKIKTGVDSAAENQNRFAVQIHKWVPRFERAYGGEDTCGDWVIADRLLVHRGEQIGRKSISVLMPEWVANEDRFTVEIPAAKRKTSSRNKDGKAPEVNLMPGTSAPIAIDFRGGESGYDRQLRVSDDAAVELLALSPDGRLLAFHGQDDVAMSSNRGRNRYERRKDWIDRISDVLRSTAAPPPGGGMGPGGPGGGFPGSGN